MVAAKLTPLRALTVATSIAVTLLQRDDMAVLAPGKQADIVSMAGGPVADIVATERVASSRDRDVSTAIAFDVFSRDLQLCFPIMGSAV